MVGDVTETRALDEMISEALAVIDKGLGQLGHRELVSSNEVADLLLDGFPELNEFKHTSIKR